MVSRYTRLRVRRKIRTHKKRVVGISESANKQLDRHIFRRWSNLKLSWRFLVGWMGLVAILVVAVVFQTRALGGFYLEAQPVPGGVYSEGVVGEFTNANPLFATSEVDTSISRLVFSPLLTYDANNQLVGDLAATWESDARAAVYTVTLKPNLVWQDGAPLTADDVVFTYKTIQNPDVKSPLLTSWQNIKVEKLSQNKIRFTLPNAYSPFLHSLTNGIVPQHMLQGIAPEQLRSSAFNTRSPVGSGPFKLKGITTMSDSKDNQSKIIKLVKFDNYNRGTPKLDGVTIHTYMTDDLLKTAVKTKEVSSAGGLNMTDKEADNNYLSTSFNLMSANMLFLKNTNPILSDTKVRQALTKATDVSVLNNELGYTAVAVKEPLLRGQTGYDPAYFQLGFNRDGAAALLDQAGWMLQSGQQYRTKNGQQLKLNLVYENSPEFSRIVQQLQKQWADVGVNLTTEAVEKGKDTTKLVDEHDYDVLLYGINIGPDPDVYAYWHSSQIDKKTAIHLNLSEYKSAVADAALEAGRTRVDPKLRAAKYKPFLEAWQNDAPAIGLYQPRYLVISNEQVYGRSNKTINVPSDRFNDINTWMINTARSKKQ